VVEVESCQGIGSVIFWSQMVAGLSVFFAANCIRLEVSLDTIPSVLGDYKPLQVVRCVKNKYLFQRLFFAGKARKSHDFWCTASRRKNIGKSTFIWG
jgi:hypothetical protein